MGLDLRPAHFSAASLAPLRATLERLAARRCRLPPLIQLLGAAASPEAPTDPGGSGGPSPSSGGALWLRLEAVCFVGCAVTDDVIHFAAGREGSTGRAGAGDGGVDASPFACLPAAASIVLSRNAISSLPDVADCLRCAQGGCQSGQFGVWCDSQTFFRLELTPAPPDPQAAPRRLVLQSRGQPGGRGRAADGHNAAEPAGQRRAQVRWRRETRGQGGERGGCVLLRALLCTHARTHAQAPQLPPCPPSPPTPPPRAFRCLGSTVGLEALAGSLQSLDLSANLLSEWREVREAFLAILQSSFASYKLARLLLPSLCHAYSRLLLFSHFRVPVHAE